MYQVWRDNLRWFALRQNKLLIWMKEQCIQNCGPIGHIQDYSKNQPMVG
jgi:hypothetical protein